MKQSNLVTVSIVIPALNEEANIQALIRNLLNQSNDNYVLDEILIISDGSEDRTVSKALELEEPKVKVWDEKTRVGKINRLNQAFWQIKSDVIVVIDADVIPTTSHTVEHLLAPFVGDSSTVYVSGALVPIKPNSFMEQCVYVGRLVWDKVRAELKAGKSIYTCHGALYALKTQFAKDNPFPESIWTDIGFHYLVCAQKDVTYFPAKNAGVYIKLPSTVSDHISQIRRYENENLPIIRYFGDWVKNEYFIPSKMLYKYKFEIFMRYPLQCLALLFLNFYANYMNFDVKVNANPKWKMIISTKEEIKNEN